MAPFFSLSGYLLAGLLVMSVLAKWKSRSADKTSLEATALGGLIRNRQALVLLWWTLIALESVVAALLALTPPFTGGVVASGFFTGAFCLLVGGAEGCARATLWLLR